MTADQWLLGGIAFLLFWIWMELMMICSVLKNILNKPDIDTIRAERARYREELYKAGLGDDD